MRYMLLSIAAAAIFLLAGGTAEAHVLQTDGDIGAVLHINPDDNPVSGTPISYVLSFADTTGRMTLPKCACGITILENGHQVARKPLVATAAMQSDDTFTFPKPDVYILKISGAPKTPGAFQPFTLSYTVRVSGGQAVMQPFPALLWVGIGATMGLLLLVGYKQGLEYNEKS